MKTILITKMVLTILLIVMMVNHSICADPPQYGTSYSGVPDPRDAVIYQVNIRAFSSYRNLQGVISRLDEIKNLGVNVIYLMPIFPVGTLNAFNSPYCIKDFKSVGTEYGTLNDLRNLVDGAHIRGMAVILDWVANQTSWDHPWITQHPDWYVRVNGVIQNLNGWTDVAALDLSKAEVRTALIEAMRYWIFAANIDGFRCDYANNPLAVNYFWQEAISNLRGITTHKLLLLAEGDNTTNYIKGFDYIFGDQYYYNVIKPIFQNNTSATIINNFNNSEYTNASSSQMVVRYISNHDVYSSEGSPFNIFGKAGVLANFVIISYMKSVPFIYNGMEVGNTVAIPFPYNSTVINWSQDLSVLDEMKKIIQFRNKSFAIRRGSLTSYTNTDICAFKKVSGSETIFVIVNLRNSTKTFTLPSGIANTTMFDAFTENSVVLGSSINLSGYQYKVFTNQGNVIPVSGVSVNPTSASLSVGQTIQLTATISPVNATNKNVIWSSGNNSIASVSSNGLVTAVAAGDATITVTTLEGGKTANAFIKVINPNTITAYFYRPANWGSFVRIYYWNFVPAGALPNVTWPGTAMKAEGNGWYSFAFSNITSTNLIFTDGINQTSDLNRTKDGWYKDYTWFENKPSTTTVYYRIKNRWQPNLYLFDAGDQLKYGIYPTSNNYAYQWSITDIGQQNGYILLKNRQTNEYMHIEHLQDYVESTTAGSDWWSAQWILEPTGDGWLRIRNRWQINNMIHVENLKSYAQHTNAQLGWYSAMWLFEEIASTTSMPTMIETKPFERWYISPSLIKRGDMVKIMGENKILNIKFFTTQGHLLYEKNNVQQFTIDSPAGTYFIQLSDGKYRETKKVIVY